MNSELVEANVGALSFFGWTTYAIIAEHESNCLMFCGGSCRALGDLRRMHQVYPGCLYMCARQWIEAALAGGAEHGRRYATDA